MCYIVLIIWLSIGVLSAYLFLNYFYEKYGNIQVLDIFISLFLVLAGPVGLLAIGVVLYERSITRFFTKDIIKKEK